MTPDIAAIFARCEPGLEITVRRLLRRNSGLRDYQEDLRQQAREILLREAQSFDTRLPDHYLLWTVRQRLFDWLRSYGPMAGARTGDWRRRNGEVSLDAELKNHTDGETLVDILPAPESDTDQEAILTALDALSTLSPRERGILVERYVRDRTQEDIARELGISAARISQIENRALGKLGAPVEDEATVEPIPTGHGEFSPRVAQVLGLSAEGLTADETADRIGVGSETVKTYRKRIIAHYHARSLLHAVALAFRAGDLE